MTYYKATIEQHLAWPETRVGHLISWLNRPIEGWDSSELCQRMYHYVAEASDIQDEAHF